MNRIFSALFVFAISLSLIFSANAFAASTSIKLTSDTAGEIKIQLCSTETVTTVDIVVSLVKSAISFATEVTGSNEVLQIITEKKYDPETKEVRIVGGNPGGIIMGTDGCAELGSITVTTTETGKIVAEVAMDKTQLLGATDIFSETPSVENGGRIELDMGTTTTPAPTLMPPTNIIVEPLSGSATITWTAGSADTYGYTIFYAKKDAYTDPTQIQSTQILGGGNTRYTIAALEPNTEYMVALATVDAGGTESNRSDAITFTTKETPETHEVATTQTPLPVVTTNAPQPVAYIVNTPDTEAAFTHAASGPEHMVVGLLALAIVSWIYARRKIA